MALAYVEGPRKASFDVVVLRANGDTAFARAYSFTPQPIPAKVQDELREDLHAAAQRSRAGAIAARAARFPPAYSPIEEIMMGRDGTVWIRLHSSANDRRWLILGNTGEILDTITMPPSARLVAADLNQLWLLHNDQWDVPSIMRYRMLRDSSSQAVR
jgi:hypothetical protein